MKCLTVTLDPHRVYAEVAGYRARELLVGVGARPMWLPRRRVWSVAFHHGPDAIARAESAGYAVTVLWAARRTPVPPIPAKPVSAAQAPSDEAVGLW